MTKIIGVSSLNDFNLINGEYDKLIINLESNIKGKIKLYNIIADKLIITSQNTYNYIFSIHLSSFHYKLTPLYSIYK